MVVVSSFPPALVIGGGYNGLGVMRTLGQAGIDVYCLTETASDFAHYSKYCHAYHIQAHVETQREPLQKALHQIARRVGERVYVHPTGDMAVLHLAQFSLDPQQFATSVPNAVAAETVIQKKKFYQSLIQHGVAHPLTLFVDAEHDEFDRDLPLPVFIKPSNSQLFWRHFARKGFIALTQSDLEKALHQVKHVGLEVMIQRIVRGPSANHVFITGYISKDGCCKRVMARQSLRQPTFFSVSSAIESIPMTAPIRRLRDVIIEYLSAIRYRGCFSAEFMQDIVTGEYLLLEVNARTGWFNRHEAVCGINLAFSAYRDAIGQPIEECNTYPSHISGIAFGRDLQTILTMARRRTVNYRDVLRSYLQPKVWLTYARDDPYPFLTRLLRRH
jgi:predicted ATP-grasp superfamily ATP-dependent carboligase